MGLKMVVLAEFVAFCGILINMCLGCLMECDYKYELLIVANILNILAISKIMQDISRNMHKDRDYTMFFTSGLFKDIKVSIILQIGLVTLCSIFGDMAVYIKVIILVIYIAGNIVSMTRYYDIKTSWKSGWVTATKKIKISKIEDNCLNGRYCKIYMDKKTDMRFAVGKIYKITYLSGTLGMYVIEAEEGE